MVREGPFPPIFIVMSPIGGLNRTLVLRAETLSETADCESLAPAIVRMERRRKLEPETDFELGPAHFDVVDKTVIFEVGFQVAIGKTAIKVFEAEFHAALCLPREI